jgi:hypothetical protein
MAALVDRIRAMLAGARVEETRMFGGISFMLNGNMLVAASEKRGLLVRVGKEKYASAITQPGTRPMEMPGRAMEGYLYVDDEHIAKDRDLKRWIEMAQSFVATLPSKAKAKAKAPAKRARRP